MRTMAEAKLDIRREDGPEGGRYITTLPEGEAELTYRRVAPDLVSADHTFTPLAARGRGAAGALVAALVADARAEGFKIRPKCPYVAVWFVRHPDAADLRAA
jgi:predicted GNAT family acetyltransferase